MLLKVCIYSFLGVAPFHCEICNKSFRAERNLKKHVKTHMNSESSYSCDMCGKSFKTIALFRAHQKNSEMCQFEKEVKIEDQYEAIVVDDLSGNTYYQLVDGQVLKPGETEGIYIIQNQIVQDEK